MQHRPKKPSQDGELTQDLYNGTTIPDLYVEVEEFMKKNPHLIQADVSIEWDIEDGMTLTAAGKPYAVYQREVTKYRKDLKAYNDWRADNREAILKHKAAEKKRIAKRKLTRTLERLGKEIEQVEAKLVSA
jgi:hypothetical protein